MKWGKKKKSLSLSNSPSIDVWGLLVTGAFSDSDKELFLVGCRWN